MITSGAELNGVDCSSATVCMAVGDDGGSTGLTAEWNGTSWTLGSSPSAGSESTLQQVSCPTPTDCFAVGGAATVTTGSPLIERGTARAGHA